MGNAKGESHTLSDQGKQLFAESTPLRQLLLDQGLSVAQTGGVPQAKIPIIQRAVEAQKQATSQNLRGAQDQLSGAGLGDSPFAQGIMQDIRSKGDQAAATVSTQVGEQMMGSAANMAIGMPTIAGSNIGNAGQLMNSAKAGSKGKGCWVADVLFGPLDVRTLSARHWVSTHDNWWTRLYCARGERWAVWLESHSWAQPLVRPVWLLMARLGVED